MSKIKDVKRVNNMIKKDRRAIIKKHMVHIPKHLQEIQKLRALRRKKILKEKK